MRSRSRPRSRPATVANFGTMTKSLHAGRTAQSGVLAARLAKVRLHGFARRARAQRGLHACAFALGQAGGDARRLGASAELAAAEDRHQHQALSDVLRDAPLDRRDARSRRAPARIATLTSSLGGRDEAARIHHPTRWRAWLDGAPDARAAKQTGSAASADSWRIPRTTLSSRTTWTHSGRGFRNSDGLKAATSKSIPAGSARKRRYEATIRERTCRAAPRYHSYAKHASDCVNVASRTCTIPVIFVIVADPVGSGFAAVLRGRAAMPLVLPLWSRRSPASG